MQRQIPQEVLFKTNSLSSWRDPNKKNRYHFKFPNNWTTRNYKDSIVGIGSLYIVPSYKKPILRIRASVLYHDEPGAFGWHELEDTVTNITINKTFHIGTRLDDFTNEFNNAVKNEFKPDIPGANLTDLIFSNYMYFNKNNFENECQFIIESPYNSLNEMKRTMIITDEVGENYYQSYMIKFEISDFNDDARELLHLEVDENGYFIDPRAEINVYKTNPLITHDIYDYNQCILRSNLASMSEDNFLGRTRDSDATRIKYYELKNSNQSFWVDLYAVSDNKTAVELTKGDDLYIEAQLLIANEAVL